MRANAAAPWPHTASIGSTSGAMLWFAVLSWSGTLDWQDMASPLPRSTDPPPPPHRPILQPCDHVYLPLPMPHACAPLPWEAQRRAPAFGSSRFMMVLVPGNSVRVYLYLGPVHVYLYTRYLVVRAGLLAGGATCSSNYPGTCTRYKYSLVPGTWYLVPGTSSTWYL